MIAPARLKIWISNICALCAAVFFLLHMTLPQDASPEYTYTVKILVQWFLPFVLIVALVTRGSVICLFRVVCRRWKIVAVAGVVCLLIPLLAPPAGQLSWRIGYLLSACWMTGTLCAAIVFFTVAARINNMLSGGLCLIGSLALAFSMMEGYLLFLPQVEDGLLDDSRHSKYVLSKQAVFPAENFSITSIGTFPKATGSFEFVAHRALKFDRELFDVRYGFDAQGRRVTQASDGSPRADLLLFGCSYTFGHGLEDTETWPWKLGKLLGPAWRISNYAFNGFGPQQMLTRLEEGMVEEPSAPERAALFLAIEHQIRRNSSLFYMHSVRYALRADGRLERDGFSSDPPYAILFFLPKYFNGSQLVRQISNFVTEYLVKQHHDEFLKTYLAILEESARLLREKYKASLTVLLWPDVEYIEPELRQRGIATLRARDLLPDWDNTKGAAYRIHPKWEWHPNAKAASELAEGLARYFRQLLTQEKGQ